jgi:hypothetical protein
VSLSGSNGFAASQELVCKQECLEERDGELRDLKGELVQHTRTYDMQVELTQQAVKDLNNERERNGKLCDDYHERGRELVCSCLPTSATAATLAVTWESR